MRDLRLLPELPLLRRELSELSARRRTYVIRVLGAVVIVAGVITMEKERKTLGLLFVTRLSPRVIVLEKPGSRLLPMLTLLLITFPMLAFAYSLGGLDRLWLLATFWLLFRECLLWTPFGIWHGLHPVQLLGNPGLSGASEWWVPAARLLWSDSVGARNSLRFGLWRAKTGGLFL
ncbi:MAG: hypothetical protein ACK5DR_08610 [Planctomyces sp.]